jgi:hypothetical protein
MSENEFFAYVPDDDPSAYREIIGDISKRPVTEGAWRRLAELYADAYRSTIFDPSDYPFLRAFDEGNDVLSNTVGVADGAAMLTLMTTFAEGVAVGRGSPVVDEFDVEQMRSQVCEYWPECSKMRVDAAAGTIAFVEKLRRSR